MTPRRVILLNGDAREDAGIATGGPITPGMLVEMTGANGYRPHSVAGGACMYAFAREQHENQGAEIDEDIPQNDEVIVLFPTVGARINALSADTISRGDPLESAGDGTLRLRDMGALVGWAGADGEDAESDSVSLNRVPVIIGGATPDLTSI